MWNMSFMDYWLWGQQTLNTKDDKDDDGREDQGDAR